MAALPAPSLCRRPWTRRTLRADYDKGVLKIKLAKKAEAKPKQIKVNVGEKTLEGKQVGRRKKGHGQAA